MRPEYLNALNIVFGTQRTRRLVQFFGSPKKAWQAPRYKIATLGIENKALEEIFRKKEKFNLDEEWQKVKKAGLNMVTLGSESYPPLLKETSSPPLGLYTKGEVSLLNSPSLAVVGTRNHSTYAKTALSKIIGELCSSGLTITSGLAQGIDAIAHSLALEAGGKTIAVLGCGLDQIFPRINLPLANKILSSKNLIVSEYPIGTPPLKQHFPARNRIIAGISLGTFVVESREKGGSLITTRHALESNREVFALPGPINYETSAGTNSLIKQGAKLVSSAQDILEELSIELRKNSMKDVIENLNEEEKNIMEILKLEPLHIDTIIKKSKLTPQRVNPIITSLELKGLIKNTGGGIWACQV